MRPSPHPPSALRLRRPLALALAMVLALLAAPALGQTDLSDRLQNHADRFERLGLSGVIAIARADEPPAFLCVGMADRLERRPNDPQTLYDLGAISTQFTAAAILRLRMAGELSMQTTLAEIFDDTPDDKQGITIEQLLAHRSGLPETVPMRAGDASHLDRAKARILASRLESEPGSTTRFSAAGYTLLAMVIAEVTGEHFPEYIRREVFAASGMRDAHFLRDTEVNMDAVAMRYAEAAGVDAIGSALINQWSWETRGVTGVVANAEDMLTWINATRHTDFFDDDAREFFWRADSGGRSPAGLRYESMSGTPRVLASGRSNGFESSVAVFPREDIAVVMLANCNGVLAKVGPEIERSVLIAPADSDEPAIASESAKRLEGTYEFEDGSRITITPTANAITLTGRGQIALERIVHGDLYEPNWSVFYAQMNDRAINTVMALLNRDTNTILETMGRDATRDDAEALIESFDHAGVGNALTPLGTVTLRDAMHSFIRIAPGDIARLRWRGRDLLSVSSHRPEDIVTIEMQEVRRGLYDGPGADNASSVRLAFEQPGIGPINTIKLLATKSAGPVTAKRVSDP